jgi:hypothetical protein
VDNLVALWSFAQSDVCDPISGLDKAIEDILVIKLLAISARQ